MDNTIDARSPARFDDSSSLRRSIVLAAAISPAFATLFVALRFYTARAVLRSFHRDDWLILIALVMSIGFSITEIFQLRYGLGLHVWELTPEEKPDLYRGFMKITLFPVAIFNNLSILFTKSSILMFYLRFSVSRPFAITTYIVLSVAAGYTLTGALSFLYACQPISKFWDFSPGGSCIDADPWFGTLVSLNVLTDITLLLLPIWLLKPLRVGLAQKTAVAGILGTGGFVLGVSIYRLYLTIDSFDDIDYLHRFGFSYMWLMIEINVAIVCACLPCLRALAARFMPSLVSVTPNKGPRSLSTIAITQITGYDEGSFQMAEPKPVRSPTRQTDSRASSYRSLDVAAQATPPFSSPSPVPTRPDVGVGVGIWRPST